MPSLLSRSQMAHSAPTQSDMDILDLLTSDQSTLGPLSTSAPSHDAAESAAAPGQKKKALPRRDSPMDALLISAVLAGSGPVTRHHFGHGLARQAYASCDESRPSSPAPKVLMKSTQAPRSERIRMEKEAKAILEREAKAQREAEGGAGVAGGDSATPAVSIPRSAQSASAPANAHALSTSPLSSSLGTKDRSTKRKMSVDPTPISRTLQLTSSPSMSNYFHPAPSYLSPNLTPAPTAHPGRIQVRCMARTRIPTPHGEMFLHLYHNSHDTKEHLALVLDPIQLDPEARRAAPRGRREIRSRSLDAVWREGETEMERVVRGAYTGRLRPGQENGRIDEQDEACHGVEMEDEGAEGLEGVEDIKPLVRIHSECFTGETIGSMRCDCGEQLDEALHQISLPQRATLPLSHSHHSHTHSTASSYLPHPAHPAPSTQNLPPTPAASRSPTPLPSGPLVPGRGVVIYLRQEGRGIGLLEKIRAYNLQDLGHDTVTANLMLGHGADERKYDIAAEMLRDLGLAGESEGGEAGESGIRLLTNNPEKVQGLAGEGIKVVERVGMTPRDWVHHHSHHAHSHAATKKSTEEESEEKEYEDWRMRRAGVGLIGAGRASGPELEKYLRTKVERMGHLIDIPDDL
ncbi:GTP cyclohydrolase II [Cryptococcus sp. DSM 104549]